jgi:hypothetical protein
MLLLFLTNVTIKLFLVRRWGRPPLPELDAAKDALIFQQLELDHYIGELLPYTVVQHRNHSFSNFRIRTCLKINENRFVP